VAEKERCPVNRPPLVSVIIPTHNRRAMLREAVDSVQAQTFTDYELIVVDDCSDDGTEEEFSGFPGLRYIRLSRRSFPSGARNRGAAEARGRYIAFLDSDDLWKKEKLEKQVAFFRSHPGIRICHTDEQWIRYGRPVTERKKHRKAGGRIFSRCLHLCLISPSAVCMEKGLFEEHGGFDESLEVGEDYHLWLKITAREEVGFIPEKLTVKRGGHADQLSRKYGQVEIFRIRALERVLEEKNLLSPGQRREAAAVLAGKYRIYARGCARRGRTGEAERCMARVRELEESVSAGARGGRGRKE